jgi:hypothetical protein
MLDYAYRLEFGPVMTSVPTDPPMWSRTPGARTSPLGIRGLINRLAGRPSEPVPAETETSRDARDRAAAAGADAALRARAEAAYRTVSGAGDGALDAALGVMEAEIGRLRDAVQAYGETLKTIEVYAGDDAARAAARAALRARPQRLRAALPVPRQITGRGERARPAHG